MQEGVKRESRQPVANDQLRTDTRLSESCTDRYKSGVPSRHDSPPVRGRRISTGTVTAMGLSSCLFEILLDTDTLPDVSSIKSATAKWEAKMTSDGFVAATFRMLAASCRLSRHKRLLTNHLLRLTGVPRATCVDLPRC